MVERTGMEKVADWVAPRLLVVDDDAELCELVAEYLTPEGFKIEAIHDAIQGLDRALSGEYSLIILNVMLSGIQGFEVLRRIRGKSRMPIIMLTAWGEGVDRIIGLNIFLFFWLALVLISTTLIYSVMTSQLEFTLSCSEQSDGL